MDLSKKNLITQLRANIIPRIHIRQILIAQLCKTQRLQNIGSKKEGAYLRYATTKAECR
ncbi:hypothetical protein PORCRE_1337 [Porphyromonas crevioricanis JCM 15906]|uniref:Uncharacterized protein n=1 Tax=Porphyromonas crevioricanis JCM 15906 TaxID=1305617 RepID=T1CP70_9PORP|nr:hypothetical protein PORCRE_1337 [Porphyromonas crevioricanis JCM 15906]